MRRFLFAALAVGLALGGLTLFAGRDDPDHGVGAGVDLPAPLDVFETEIADAHHTHSPTTICNYLAYKISLYSQYNYVVVDAWTSQRDSTGHPIVASCILRNTTTFWQGRYCINYYNHYYWRC